MTTKAHIQCTCPECEFVVYCYDIDYVNCPECGCPLPTVSSEDGDDGVFAEREKEEGGE